MLLYPEENELVSVIVTCHDYEQYLDEAIESILDQEANTEIIIVNDSPSNNHLCNDIISKYHGIKLIEVEYNDPLFARRSGFDNSTGEYVIFLDADDKLGTEYIHQALDVMKDNCIVFSDMQYFGSDTRKTDYPSHIDKKYISLTNFLHVGCMTNRNLITLSKAFDHPMLDKKYHEDWYFWRKMITSVPCDIVKQKGLYHTRLHDKNRSLEINKLLYYDMRGTKGDKITFCDWDGNSDFIANQAWPTSQIHEIIFDPNKHSKSHSYSYVPFNDKLDVLNYIASTITTDYVFFFEDTKKLNINICEKMLRNMDHKNGIVHDVEYDILRCTMISALLIKNRLFHDISDIKRESIKYV